MNRGTVRNEAGWRTEFWKALSPVGHLGYDQHATFRMFCEAAFRALHGTTLKHLPGGLWDANEKAYLAIANRTREPSKVAHANRDAFHVVVAALEDLGPVDFLGPIMMEAGGNKDAGQFFTPMSICDAMSEMLVADLVPDSQPTWSVLEPAAGAGALLISTANAFRKRGVSTLRLRTEAWDVDDRCVWMAYIQTTLLAIPCTVVHGNTLTQERFGVYANIHCSAFMRAALMLSKLSKDPPGDALNVAEDCDVAMKKVRARPERVRVILNRD